MKIEFLKDAENDLHVIGAWYASRAPAKILKRFQQNLEVTIRLLHSSPLLFEPKELEIRFAPIRGFPYRVAYKVFSDRILLVAIIHYRRNPDSLDSRIESSENK